MWLTANCRVPEFQWALSRCAVRMLTLGRDSMRVLIVTAGSYGDVAPLTGLGQRLGQSGHDVAIAAHAVFADLVRGCGLAFRPLPGDPVEMARARTAAPTPGAERAAFLVASA